MAYIVPPLDVVHIDGLTVGKMLDLYVENSIRVYRSLFYGIVGPNFGFHVHMY